MSGFESAIRNAIARAPDGRPQTRARIYDAARASLQRNLARVEVPDADSRRSALEMTIERIEAEWRAISMHRPERRPDAAGPDVADERPPDDGPAATPDARHSASPSEPESAASLEPGSAAATAPPASSSVRAVDRRDGVPAPEPRAATPMRAPLDPVLVEQLAERDGERSPDAVGPVNARTPPPSPSTPGAPHPSGPEGTKAVPHGVGTAPDAREGSPLAAPVVGSDDLVATRSLEDGDAPPVGPAVEAPTSAGTGDDPGLASDVSREHGKRSRGKRPRAAKADRGARKGDGRRAGGKGRWASWVVSVAILLGVAVLGWRWLDQSGMLEPTGPDRVAVSVPGDGGTVRGEAVPREWTALMTRELSGAVEPVAGQDALRVTGPAEVALDAEQLVALGPDIRLSLLVRAVAEAGEVAVSCDFPGGGCGRLRFPLPREAEERVVTATVAETMGEGGEARLVLDPTVGGETVPFDLLGVTARAL